jgi:hypothetical protein
MKHTHKSKEIRTLIGSYYSHQIYLSHVNWNPIRCRYSTLLYYYDLCSRWWFCFYVCPFPSTTTTIHLLIFYLTYNVLFLKVIDTYTIYAFHELKWTYFIWHNFFFTQARNSSSNVRYFLQWFILTTKFDLCSYMQYISNSLYFFRANIGKFKQKWKFFYSRTRKFS